MTLKERLKNKLKEKIKNTKILDALENPTVRARVFFVLSVLPTLIFAIFNAVIGAVYRSVWYGSLAAYYIMLVVQKILLVAFSRHAQTKYACSTQKCNTEKIKIYIINGVFLLVLTLALTAAIVQMATTEKPQKTDKIVAIATAAYTFFKIISASINVVKTKKTGDVILMAMRNIGFVAATVSMLALTSTLICTFGTIESMRAMLAAVSVAVGLITTSTGILMIVNGAKKLKNQNQNNSSSADE